MERGVLSLNVGFTCSCFDLLHTGHIMMLKECRINCDRLIVGLQTDPSIDRNYKNKPIQGYFERYIQLEAVKYVDEIVPYETEEDLIKLLYYIKPNIRFVGSDWRNKEFTGKDILEIEIFYNRRYGYSTTELKGRIESVK